MSSRRVFLVSLGVGLLAPTASLAQKPARIFRIGFLSPGFASGYVRELESIRAGLRDLGYLEGKNIVLELRWAEGNADQLQKMAAELVALKVDVLITHAIPGARAATRATKTIPIVVADVTDPIAAGLIASYARPGGNLTGSTSFQIGIQSKRLELLKEIAPRIKRVAYLVNASNDAGFALKREGLEESAKLLKLELHEFSVREPVDFPDAFNSMIKSRIEAAVIGEDPFLNSHASAIAALALSHRLPSSGFMNYADAGGLLSYGANRAAVYGRSAYFVDRILKGAKPGEIAYEQATRFELIVNTKTAKALSLTIPPAIRVRMDRTI